MLKIVENVDTTPKNRWIRFEWDTGFLEIDKRRWDKLSKKMKNRILSLGVEK